MRGRSAQSGGGTSMEVTFHIFALAAIYGLFACGLTLIFGVMDVLTVAHATVFAFAAVFSMYLVGELGFDFWLGCLCAVVAAGGVSILVDRIAFRPLRYRAQSAWGKHIGPLLTSLGVSTIFLGIMRAWFGIDPRFFPNEMVEIEPIVIGDQIIQPIGIALFALFAALVVLLTYALKRTRWGVEMRAVAESTHTAALFGINVERRFMEIMALAGVLAGLAAIAWGFAFNIASPETGAWLEVKAFALIIIGGMGSIPGSLVGAIVIAAIEVLGTLWLPEPGMAPLMVFAALIVILIVRPQGFLGERVKEGAR
ncbi:branched-chain amino acid ABC transporter permease [Marivibrio halodurans]|nr:branched-chain amino acid ABC transporter permease [Marivibrio halodurans]